MPYACFSYSADVPLGIGNRDATQQCRHASKICFSYYPGDLPHDIKIAATPGGLHAARLASAIRVTCHRASGAATPAAAPHDSKLCFSYSPRSDPVRPSIG